MNLVNFRESGIADVMAHQLDDLAEQITTLKKEIAQLKLDNTELKKHNLLLGGALQFIKKQRGDLEGQQIRILHELSESLALAEKYRRLLEMVWPHVADIEAVAGPIRKALNEQ